MAKILKSDKADSVEKQVVFIGPEKLIIDPTSMVEYDTLSLGDFKEKLIETPSLGFNAHQRLFTALNMFGYDTNSHGRRRYNWLDDWVDMPGKELHENEVHGLEETAEALMSHLSEATINPIQQKKYILLVGPPGSAKTTLVKSMSKCLDAFGYLPEGAVYTVEFDLSDYHELFKGSHEKDGLKSMVCPAHENPLNFLPREDLSKVLKEVNGKVSLPGQKIYPRTDMCPACNYVVQKLRKEGADLNKIIKVRRLYNNEYEGHNVSMAEFRPTDPKNYDATQLFGGGLNFNRFKNFISDIHPLVNDYGMGGFHDGPSAQRHMVHFSEMYKYDEECLNELLDAINEMKLSVKQRYPVNLDLVMVGTSNLNEYQKKGVENKSLGEYLTSRGITMPVPYVVVLDDITKALKKTVYTERNTLGIHIPPHFEKSVMGVLNVISAIEPSESFSLDLYQKMLVLNHQSPPGLEAEQEIIREELIRSATKKPILEIEEGIKLGIPFRFFQNSIKPFRAELKKIDVDPDLVDERYEHCLTHLSNIDTIIYDSLRSYEGMNDETRMIAIEEALPLALTLWQQRLSEDVNLALMGNKTIETEGARYLAMVLASSKGDSRYTDIKTRQSQLIDREYLAVMDQLSGVRNPSDFRNFYANAVRHRVGIQDGVMDAYDLSRTLLNEDERFRAMMQQYVIEVILPRNVDNVSTAYSPDNTLLINTLKDDFGYCKSCASFAIAAASVLKKNKSGSLFTTSMSGGCDGNCGSCSK